MTSRIIGAVAGLLAALVVGSAAHALGGDGAGGNPVVLVEGDAANGFGIHYRDGTAIYPPTDSEAAAECSEYDTRRQRIRCRVEVRTWYRDLAVLRDALEHAHGSPDAGSSPSGSVDREDGGVRPDRARS